MSEMEPEWSRRRTDLSAGYEDPDMEAFPAGDSHNNTHSNMPYMHARKNARARVDARNCAVARAHVCARAKSVCIQFPTSKNEAKYHEP